MRTRRLLITALLIAAIAVAGLWFASKTKPVAKSLPLQSAGESDDLARASNVSNNQLQLAVPLVPSAGHPASIPDFRATLGQHLLEPDTPRRAEHMLEILEHWAAHDARGAAEWLADHFHDIPVDPAFAVFFHGAVYQTDLAIALANEFSARFPERRPHIGSCLIAALGRIGEHQRAAEFALNTAEENDPLWAVAAFHHWGEHAPEDARVFISSLQPSRRRTAFRAMVSGWARGDPAGLAHAAVDFEPTEEREFALITALRQWAARAPDAAADFMVKNGPLPRAALVLED